MFFNEFTFVISNDMSRNLYLKEFDECILNVRYKRFRTWKSLRKTFKSSQNSIKIPSSPYKQHYFSSTCTMLSSNFIICLQYTHYTVYTIHHLLDVCSSFFVCNYVYCYVFLLSVYMDANSISVAYKKQEHIFILMSSHNFSCNFFYRLKKLITIAFCNLNSIIANCLILLKAK